MRSGDHSIRYGIDRSTRQAAQRLAIVHGIGRQIAEVDGADDAVKLKRPFEYVDLTLSGHRTADHRASSRMQATALAPAAAGSALRYNHAENCAYPR